MDEVESQDRDGRDSEDDDVGRLLHLAGLRPEVPERALAEITRGAHAAWRRKVRSHEEARRRARRPSWGLAAAAVLVLAAGATFLWRPAGPGPAAVATVEVAFPGTRLLEAGEEGDGRVPAVGTPLPAGATLVTGPKALVALRLAGGTALRLDASSRLTLEGPARLALAAGAVYLDSGADPAAGTAVAVHTAFGVASDVGTQFEVRLVDGGLRLQVREGEVRLERSQATHSVPAGGFLRVAADGTVESGSTSGHGEGWLWFLPVVPAFELEGRKVADFLGWAGREMGYRLRYAEPGLEQRAATIVAHGSIAGLTPREALDVVLPSAGLDYRYEGGELIVTSGR